MIKPAKNNPPYRFLATLDASLSVFIASYKNKLILLMVFLFTLFFLSSLPYFNLFLNKTTAIFIVWVLAVFLLNLSGRFSIKVALILLCFCPLLLITQRPGLAKETGDLVYGLLLIGVIQEFVGYLREGKSEKEA